MSKWIGGLKERPDWDAYFMSIAFVVSQRSIDPNTCHGAIIADKNNKIVSQGYNGPPPGINDAFVPISAPEKYDWFIHAEMNAIYNSKDSLDKCKIYITGMPCKNCAKHICATGIEKVVFGSIQSSMICGKDIDITMSLFKSRNIEVVNYNKMDKVIKNLERTLNYIEYKKL